ncbi:benzoate 4-monooxygenase cytochrome P450 [Aaosphaeria arxii CBS 175.79]|uniref:Benzoate 4-monooxygenase cytochrome P450 n=1 Tax=Aaosphaeria arxii CBS 175.79 TaxID=1450172 RepID=A0A6A5X6R7_9PLEO|nr:benzoate 4-monooxygenase cytochrome P450 [Aaosphaeria arxii CBS 175.79]KAF2008705.1 benzoate 4-monooxygenase cytochrome P450 [Aaosphaeria arxii CBS 175.79]
METKSVYFHALWGARPTHDLAFAFCLLAVFAVGVVVLVALRRVWFHPLGVFPGPNVWAASRLPWVRHMVKGDLWRILHQHHIRFGSIVRIAPNELSILSPSAWHDIYVSRPLLLKEPFGQTPPLNGAHSLFTAEGHEHRRIRGTLAHAFSDKALRDQASLIEHHANQLVSRLRRELKKSSSHVLDISKLYGYATFDIVTDFSYGESAEGLVGDNEHNNIARFFLHAQYSTVRNCLRWYSPLDKLLDVFFLRVSRSTREQNWALALAKVNRRLAKGDMTGIRSDLMTPIVGRISEEGGKGITKAELLSSALGIVIAGCQLTTVALTSCTFFLLQNPRALERLLQEIRTTFTAEEDITIPSTQHLSYLDAVLNETIRIHHPSPISLPRMVPPEGRVIDSTFIPGNNSPEFWVEPHNFHPERFLSSTNAHYEARFENDVKAAFMPFSTGPRNCIGAKLSMAIIKVTLAKVLWNFDLSMAEPDVANWQNQRVCIVFEPKPLRVEVMDRSSSKA